MDTPSWTMRVGAATTEAGVLGIVHEYAAAKAEIIKALPVECRPVSLTNMQEVGDCAYRLAAYLAHGEDARLVQNIASFFARASIRLAELRTHPNRA